MFNIISIASGYDGGMKMTGNTILITGGGSGIGRSLAEEFHKLGNQVIVAGRRRDALDSVTAAHPGMTSAVVDLADAASIQSFAARIAAEYPALNVLINNAGIMKPEKLQESPANLADAEMIVATNLLAPIRLTAAFLPLFQKQDHATIMMVSSGLAFVPLTMTPTYCATKAAIHSYAQSLRRQLKDTKVEVLELVPPYVATELMGSHQANDPRAMPLGEFIAEVMQILATRPEATEILVKRVVPLRFAEEKGPAAYQQMFDGLNRTAF
ncbi:MAG TPA: SDR family oxidoreductase [Bryobacteraceae bacterium]